MRLKVPCVCALHTGIFIQVILIFRVESKRILGCIFVVILTAEMLLLGISSVLQEKVPRKCRVLVLRGNHRLRAPFAIQLVYEANPGEPTPDIKLLNLRPAQRQSQ